MRTALKGYRTIVLSTAVAVNGFLQATDWTVLGFSAQTAGWIVMVLGVVGIILRFYTDTPAGRKE